MRAIKIMAFTAYLFILLTCFLILKEKNIIFLFLTILISLFLFVISITNFAKKMDVMVNFALPFALTITKTAWIAHPISETIGILSVSAGIYVCATDIILIYMFWRMFDFPIKKNISNGLILTYIFFIICSCVSAFVKEFAFAGVLLYIKCYILYNWFVNNKQENKKKWFVIGMSAALVFQGIIAILQKIKNGPIGLTFLGENNDALRYRIVNGSIDRGAAGTFEHSSRLAIFVIFALLIVAFSIRNQIIKNMIILWGILILYFAASRTAILIFVIAALYHGWKARSRMIKKRHIIAAFCFLGIAAIGFIYAVYNNMLDFIFNSDLSFQVMNRINHWILAMKYISEKFLFGYGINNYSAKMSTIDATNFYFINPVHNNYLLNWFEVGIGGFILYIVILLYYLIQIQYYKSSSCLKKSALLFVICVIIYNFTGWAFAAPTCIYFLWIAFGLIDSEK